MSATEKGFFLVIEGLDGSGKTEIAHRLTHLLQNVNPHAAKLTFEPHDPSCAGLFIRQVLMHRIAPVSPHTLALAFAVNRADHLAREITPFLASGANRVVVCDRYYLSSLVFQAAGALTMEDVMHLNREARRPDLTILLSASAATCYERMRRRSESRELFEKNLKQTRARYDRAIEFLRARGEPIVEVNADGTPEEVLNDVLATLREHGPSWLPVDRPILLDSAPTLFSLSGDITLRLQDIASEVHQVESRGTVEADVAARLAQLDFDKASSLFLDYLSNMGYRIGERLPWTDLDALTIEYGLPGGHRLRGAAVLLHEARRFDAVTKRILSLDQHTDFLFIFDPTPHRLSTYQERDALIDPTGKITPSPSIRIIELKDLANEITRLVTSMRAR